MSFDRRSLVVPDGTQIHEHTIVLPHGDAVVADDVSLDFGIDTPGRAFIGERVKVGNVVAGGDVRIDLWSRVRGDVTAGGSTHLGEKVHVEGKLVTGEDLDVGDEVKIEKGFEARGWINIRSPVPMVLYVFIYLMQLMGQGRSEEVERILRELERAEDVDTLLVDDVFLYVPDGTRLGLQDSLVKGPLQCGENARLVGNFKVHGHATVGRGTTFHGSLMSDGNVHLAEFAEVMGDVTAKGTIHLADGARVHGSINGRNVEMRHTAVVDGTVHADDGVKFVTPEMVAAREKVEAFESGRYDLLQYF